MNRLANRVLKFAAVAAMVCGVFSSALGETYWLAGDDGYNASSLTGGGAGWKDSSGTVRKLTPSAGNTYIVDNNHNLRTPAGGSAHTVVGRLVISDGQISDKMSHTSVLTLNDALVTNGVCRLSPGDIGYRYYVKGNMEIAADGILEVQPYLDGTADWRNWNLANTITGSGMIHILHKSGTVGPTHRDPNVVDDIGVFMDGNFSGFTGKIKVENPFKQTLSTMHVTFTTATAFPGALAETTADGFVLDGLVHPTFNVSGVFDFTRGFVFGTAADDPRPILTVAAGKEVTINGPVSGLAGFIKTGAGKLTISKRSSALSGTVTVREGTLVHAGLPNATLVPEGSGQIVYEGGSGTIGVVATDYAGYEDDDSHGITVTIDREDGVEYVQEWSEDGATFGATEPKYQAAGEHTVWCRVSADGYEPVTVTAKVRITLRTIVASMYAEKVKPADGQSHALPELTVVEPVEGYALDWTVNGVSYGSVAPSFADVGAYAATCTITAPHYAAKTLSGTLYLRTAGDVYVDAASTGGVPPYDAPEKAMDDLETAFRITGDGCAIHVLPGTYALGAALTLDRRLNLLGPADRSAVIRGDRQIAIKDGSMLAGFTFENTPASTKTLAIDPDAVVSNVFVRGGTAPIYLRGRFYDSEVTDFVGAYGVKVVKRTNTLSARIERVKITNGHDFDSSSSAPIMTSEDSSTPVRLSMVDCEVSGCTNTAAYNAAGAILCNGNDNHFVALTRCRFVNNAARIGAIRGAVNYASHSSFAVTNCLFADNLCRTAIGSGTTSPGPVVWLKGEFVNCTFANNDSEDRNVGVFQCTDMSSQYCTQVISLKNCIVSGNAQPSSTIVDGSQMVLPTATTSMFPECVPDDENGNIAGPARFKGGTHEPYALKASSPGIGAGAILGWTKQDADLAGKRRVQGGSVDMGCYQSGAGMMIFVQ